MASLAQIPSYATLPRSGEQTLENHGSAQVGRSTKRLTVTLDNATGLFAPGGLVSGRVGVRDAKDVLKIEVKLNGVLRTKTANTSLYLGGGVDNDRFTMQLVSELTIAWDKKTAPARTQCPAELPFQLRLPKTFFDDKGKEWTVPPTFDTTDMSMRNFVSYARYSVVVTATLARTLTSFWAQDETLSTPITVRGISRPAYPSIAASLVLGDGFAAQPDVWSQHDFHLTSTGPIAVQLHLPKPTAYYMGAPIPFRVQFTGAPDALAPFQPGSGKGRVYVSIERQTTITVEDGELVHRLAIGTCTHLEPASDTAEDALAWTGEVFVEGAKAATLSGGFRAGPVVAADCIVVGVSPPDAKDTARLLFTDSQRRVPIALTTEPWVDDGSV